MRDVEQGSNVAGSQGGWLLVSAVKELGRERAGPGKYSSCFLRVQVLSRRWSETSVISQRGR